MKVMGKGTTKAVVAAGIWALVIAASPVSASPNTAVSPTIQSAADNLEDRIENLIQADSTLKDHSIDVKIDGSTVTLTGKVPSQRQKDRAAEIARVSGISRVDNKIVVDASSADKDAVDKTKGAVDTAADKTGKAVATAGEKSKEGVQKAGSEVTDAYILSRINSKFIGVDVLEGSDINVDSDKQVVTLKGMVPSEAARARAIALAKETEGVKRVVDRLTIAPKK
jgi:hyperosmotically inducible periplasmic protein